MFGLIVPRSNDQKVWSHSNHFTLDPLYLVQFNAQVGLKHCKNIEVGNNGNYKLHGWEKERRRNVVLKVSIYRIDFLMFIIKLQLLNHSFVCHFSAVCACFPLPTACSTIILCLLFYLDCLALQAETGQFYSLTWFAGGSYYTAAR